MDTVLLIRQPASLRSEHWSIKSEITGHLFRNKHLLKTRNLDGRRILLFTSVAFLIWHVPVAFLEMGEGFPRSAIPVYLANVILLGLNWGLMRLVSGSVLVPSLSHAVWNAIAYKFFGFGVEFGELARPSLTVLDPERGVVGIALNAAFLVVVWALLLKKHRV